MFIYTTEATEQQRVPHKCVRYRCYGAIDVVVQAEDVPACVARRYLRPHGNQTVKRGRQTTPPPRVTGTPDVTSSRRTSSLFRISALSNWAFVALTAVSKIPVRLCWYRVVAGRTSSGLGRENTS